MEYEEIKLNVSNDKISEYKVFYGIKLYSDIFTSEDKKTLKSKRIYSTKKKNYVYYERTDVNWNYWSDKRKYDSNFDTNEVKRNIVFEVSQDLNSFSKYLDEKIIKKLILKEKNGEIVERLDI
uniref:EXLDI protein n=1 Tax=Myoviridae sp. ctqMr7 TaxID=2823552 RepID=A0A8S5LH55_9CAUD|nr:MAG TPA: EXLDI protein [Myoviridae sp. ctqMr7]